MQEKEKQTKPFKDTPPPPLTTFKESYIIITSSYIRAQTLPAAHVANIRAEQYFNAGLFPKNTFLPFSAMSLKHDIHETRITPNNETSLTNR